MIHGPFGGSAEGAVAVKLGVVYLGNIGGKVRGCSPLPDCAQKV